MSSSLRAVFDCLEAPLIAEPRAAGRLLEAIEAGPVQPRMFGAYVDLVVALFDEREPDAQVLIDELLSQPPAAPATLRLVTLDDRELGPGQSERYRRFVNDDVAFVLEPVSGDARAAASALLVSAFELVREGAPDVSDEFQALVRELVLVTGRFGADGPTIGGASTFSLWGALFLNVDTLGDRLSAAIALAHEVGHSYLLGLTQGRPLVENDDDERYPSPLRREPRPMDGVAHATYVLARMIHALRALNASGRLDARERAEARDRLEQMQAAYERGLATVRQNARFTTAGAAAFDQMQQAMGATGG